MPSGMQVEQLPDRFILTSDPLRLELSRQRDRWEHRIFVRPTSENSWTEILTSIEGTAEDPSPPSSALQDCFLQEIESGTQELQLLGQAGKNVYSAAIRFVGQGNVRQDNEISFDFCLRAPMSAGVPAVLSTYKLLVPMTEISNLDPNGLVCRIPIAASRFVGLEAQRVAESGRLAMPLQLNESGSLLQITGAAAVEVTANAARRSLRWRYRLRLLASA